MRRLGLPLGFPPGVLGGGATAITWLLRDEFTTDEAAPLTSPRTAEPGPGTLTIIDTENKQAVTHKALTLDGGKASPEYGDPGIYGPGFDRIAGRTALFYIGGNTNGENGAVGWHSSQNKGIINSLGLLFTGVKWRVLEGSISYKDVYTWAVGANHFTWVVGVILRTSGAFVVAKYMDDWKLYWVARTNTTTPIYPAITSYNLTTVSDFVRVVDLSSPWDDSFGIAVSHIAGSIDEAQTFEHAADGFLCIAVTALPTSGQIEIAFRMQDANNYWQVTVDASGNLDLDEVVAGSPIQRATKATIVNAGENLTVRFVGTEISIWEESGNRQINYTGATNFTSETAGKLLSLGTGGQVSDLETYPYNLTGNVVSELDAIVPCGTQDISRAEWIGNCAGANTQVIPLGGTGDSDESQIREIGNILYESDDAGAEYKTWYTGVDSGGNEKIHYAYSSDGVTWTKYAGNPVISTRQEDPYVVKSGGTYYMFCEDKASGQSRIRRWSSVNLTTWSDDGQCSGFASADVASPTVWIEDSTWYMLYEDMSVADPVINLATSANGLVWTDNAANPVFDHSDCQFAANRDLVPDDIILRGGTYYMTYHHYNYVTAQTGIASSSNKTAWVDHYNSPVGSKDETLDGGKIKTAMMVNDGADDIVFLFYVTNTSGILRGFALGSV